ncbi:type I pullulanase [Paenibacillus sp. F411]|nr:type I pullulanase [Paenibacillus sp. F411]
MMMNRDMIQEITDQRFGLIYSAASSTFRLWAPSAAQVSLMLYKNDGVEGGEALLSQSGGSEHPMLIKGNGVWETNVSGDWAGWYYMYRIRQQDGQLHEAVDPYARAVSANGRRGAIVDPAQCSPDGWESDTRPPLASPTDAVLYELHVRDFSISPDSGMTYKGKFKAFTETGLRDEAGNKLGIDHLVELGVTHVHLLPIFDFKTVDELISSNWDPEGEYNWGYDPQHYNVPEGSYATDPRRPETRIVECKEMIQALHQHGIRVIMDVVYNHTYSVEEGPFEPVAPGYFYRQNHDGTLSNGSGVGNELATERPMVRKFIKDSLRYWAEEYHLDGFRFDLMALIDTETMVQIVEELRREVAPDLLIYGEPWTGGGSPLANQTVKGTQRGKGFAVFNDDFRHAIKGDNDGGGKGFATGEAWYEGAVAEGLMGSIHDFALEASETVNYVTVHDNLNLWDKVLVTMGKWDEAGFIPLQDGRPHDGSPLMPKIAAATPYADVVEGEALASEAVKRSLLANSMVLLSQGIPLIHAGDELLRTKYGDHNSYRSGDAINAISWSHKERFTEVFRYYQGLIRLRRQHPAFRLNRREEIEKHMEIIRCSDRVVAYRLHSHAGNDEWKQIVAVFNGGVEAVSVELPPTLYGWNVVVNEREAGTEVLSTADGAEVTVQGLSCMVLYEDPERLKSDLTEVHVKYDREDGDYAGWNLWVWGTGVQDGEVSLTPREDGDAGAVFYTAADVKKIGCILRLNEWEAREWEQDRFITVPEGEKTIRIHIHSDGVDIRPHNLGGRAS